MKIRSLYILLLMGSSFSTGWGQTSAKIDTNQVFDANYIRAYIGNNGIFANNPVSGGIGLWYNSNRIIWTSGLWLAARVNGEVLASASDYTTLTDFTCGAIDSAGIPFGKNESLFRIYKISSGDSATNNPDYADWPVQYGAPVDSFGKPLLLGNQTLWCSYTDAYVEERNYNPCSPLNAEIHLTVWGSIDLPGVMFLRWEFFNKGDVTWQDAYTGFFVDPDLGDTNNNLVGSDSLLSMVYCYEDTHYQFMDSTFAAAYLLLESPVVLSQGDTAVTFEGLILNFRNSGKISPLAYKHFPYEWGMPQHGRTYARYWIYRRLMGLDTSGTSMMNPVSGDTTLWGLSGDPVNGTGWIDPVPQDRFMMISAGPFDLAAGKKNAMTVAIVIEPGINFLEAVTKLKDRAAEIKQEFKDSLEIITTDVPVKPPAKIEKFKLKQNYPNPFNPVTTLRFQTNQPGQTSLIIYNLLGQEIRRILDKNLAPGNYELLWDGKNDAGQSLSSGIYFARLKNGKQSRLIKMVLVR